MRHDVEFPSRGMMCRGWLYVPDGLEPGARAGTVVMAHGFSGVKELDLDRFAQRFTETGLAALVFDYRYLGASDGEPRGQVLFREQLEDYRNAISWATCQPQVDGDRIGIWGTSFSGGHALHLGAFDPRVKVIVAQVPFVGAWRGIVAQHGVESLRFMLEMVNGERVGRYPDGDPTYVPVVAPPGAPAALPAPDAHEWFVSGATAGAPSWENRVTVESIEQLIEYDPAASIGLVAPKPLLVVAAEHDSLIPISVVREAFERAGDPKELLVLPCGHFDVYHEEPFHSQAVCTEAEWLSQHLGCA